MNDIQIFNFEEQEVRTTVIDNLVWFVGKDVAKVLGYKNFRDALLRHVDPEDKKDGVVIHDSIGREQKPTFINESGVYSLVMSSKLPTAKKFKRWVTSEVLPSIRKTGGYGINSSVLQSAANLLGDPDFAIQIFTALKEERDKNELLEAKVEEDRPKVDCFETFLDTGELTGFRDSAHLLNIPEQKFMNFLEDAGFIYRNGKNKPRAYAKYLDKGYFDVKFVKCFDGKSRDQTFITPLGLSAIHKKYREKQRRFSGVTFIE